MLAPDRDRGSGAWPVVSVSGGEDAEFLRELERRQVQRVELQRRGRQHGALVVLRPEGLQPPKTRPKRLRALFRERHTAARPSVLRGVLDPQATRLLDGSCGAAFLNPGALSAWLDACLPAGLQRGDSLPHQDPERDLERYAIVEGSSGLEAAGKLWVKTSRLSTHPEDDSVRMRISFGDEGQEDSSRDEPRQARVSHLGRALLPAVTEIEASSEMRGKLEAVLGGGFYFTQHIAYWNARQGGALFHHDAFDEELEGGQRGVLYVQLDGATAWLALSLEDLAVRIGEFAPWLEDEELAGLRGELFGDAFSIDDFRRLVNDWRGLRSELALPGCGRLAALVNRGPEFTAFLADAGHAAFLEAGDAIYLPNHGLERTAMHSVFHAGSHTGLGLSLALRRTPGEGVQDRDVGP